MTVQLGRPDRTSTQAIFSGISGGDQQTGSVLIRVLAEATPSDSITGVAGWMTGLIDALGSVGIGLIVVAETVFPPIPSEVVLPAAGYLAGLGQLGFWATVVCATIGSVLGALLLYAGGRWVGAVRLGYFAARLPLMSAADVERAWVVFERWQQPAVFFGRLVPGVRSLVSIPAGAKQMPLGRFVVLTTLGSAIWNFVLIGAGWWLGDRYGATSTVSHWMNVAVFSGAALLVVWFVVSKLRARRPRSAIDHESSDR